MTIRKNEQSGSTAELAEIADGGEYMEFAVQPAFFSNLPTRINLPFGELR